MSGLSRRLKQLDEELLALGEETMLLEELDGFIAGLLVCPDLIKPGEWLPIIWNRDSTDPQPAIEDLDHVNRVLGLVMEHYNSVARTLMERPDRYSPLFSVDTRNGDILWELWIEGFETAVELEAIVRELFAKAHARARGQGTVGRSRLPDPRLAPGLPGRGRRRWCGRPCTATSAKTARQVSSVLPARILSRTDCDLLSLAGLMFRTAARNVG